MSTNAIVLNSGGVVAELKERFTSFVFRDGLTDLRQVLVDTRPDCLIINISDLEGFKSGNPFYGSDGTPLLPDHLFFSLKGILLYLSVTDDDIYFELDKIREQLRISYPLPENGGPQIHFFETSQIFNYDGRTGNDKQGPGYADFLFYLFKEFVSIAGGQVNELSNSFFRTTNTQFTRYIRILNAIRFPRLQNPRFKIVSVSYFGKLNGKEHYLVDAPFKHYYERYDKGEGLNNFIEKLGLAKLYYQDYDEKKPYVNEASVHVRYQSANVNGKSSFVIVSWEVSGQSDTPTGLSVAELVKGWVQVFQAAAHYADMTTSDYKVYLAEEAEELEHQQSDGPIYEIYFLLKRIQNHFNFDGLINTIFYRHRPIATPANSVSGTIKDDLSNSYYPLLIPKALEEIMPIYNEELKAAELKTAVISILVDSYAHNISAHSMVALEEWFRHRSELLEKKIYVNNNSQEIQFGAKRISSATLKDISEKSAEYYAILGLDDQTNTDQFISLADIIRLKAIDIQSYFTGHSVALDEKTGLGLVDRGQKATIKLVGGEQVLEEHEFPVPVDYALWQFFRFLKGKAAFWSGVTRDLPFGGEHISLYELFFKHFSENPLYLGTIAHTEGINKLNIKIGLDLNFGVAGQREEIAFYDFIQINTELIQSSGQSVPDTGALGHFTNFSLATGSIKNKTHKRDLDYSEFGFVRFGFDFERLKNTFEQAKKVFLPGGLVGIHSFLTIIENTIRNVKHYKHHIGAGDHLREQGLTLLITVEQMDLFNQKVLHDAPGLHMHRLYRMGVALGHPLQGDGRNVQESISRRLFENIVDVRSRAPKLGGTSQDKVCSAMLLNNQFMSVETVKTARDYFYYPWIHPKQLNYQDLVAARTLDPELAAELRKKVSEPGTSFSKEDKQKDAAPYLGKTCGEYVFKFFNLWASGEVVHINANNETGETLIAGAENYARFKFAVLPVGQMKPYLRQIEKRRQERQIFRIIESNEPELSTEQAYRIWNASIFHTGNKLVSIFYDSGPNRHCLFGCKVNATESPANITIAYNSNQQGHLLLTHGNNEHPEETCNYRSHGKLIEYFAKNADISRGVIKAHFPEFIETMLMTIKIWDDRIYERVKALHKKKYRLGFNLSFFPENYEERGNLLFIPDEKHTIYIIHLSFIENLKDNTPSDGLTEEGNLINWFIRNYLGGALDANRLTLTIISGRGNADWFEGVDSTYLPGLIYRPVESVIDAVEDALIYGDDFQLKYNICKTIIGS